MVILVFLFIFFLDLAPLDQISEVSDSLNKILQVHNKSLIHAEVQNQVVYTQCLDTGSEYNIDCGYSVDMN